MKATPLGPAVSLPAILDLYTKQISEKNAKSKYFPLRPSSAGKCARRLAYELANFRGKRDDPPEVFEPNVKRLLALGNSVEYHLLGEFYSAFKEADSGMDIRWKQQSLTFFNLPHTGELIEGSLDAVFVAPKWKCVIDVKSTKDNWSSFYKSKWTEKIEEFRKDPLVTEIDESSFYIDDIDAYVKTCNDDSFKSNMLQLNFYFNSDCGFLRKRGVTFCSLLYYSKNSSEVREIRFRPSIGQYEYVKNKFLSVADAVDGQNNPELAPKEATLGSFTCAFCPYAKLCWGDDVDSKKEYFASWPKKSWPKDVDRIPEHDELVALHDEYAKATDSSGKLTELEQKIIKLLDKNNIRKVKFNEHAIYEVKHLKTGGVGGGARRVLRRTKV